MPNQNGPICQFHLALCAKNAWPFMPNPNHIDTKKENFFNEHLAPTPKT
jgi:hypothetical protein